MKCLQVDGSDGCLTILSTNETKKLTTMLINVDLQFKLYNILSASNRVTNLYSQLIYFYRQTAKNVKSRRQYIYFYNVDINIFENIRTEMFISVLQVPNLTVVYKINKILIAVYVTGEYLYN